jgi:acetyl-CoA C-acetyltransferase
MMVDAAFEAFEDAGVSPQDIQAAWVGATPSGTTGQALSHLLQLIYIPMTREDNARATAQDALCNACFAVAAGVYDIALALGFDNCKNPGFLHLRCGDSWPLAARVYQG